jgi:CheY-like chemotaxis protein
MRLPIYRHPSLTVLVDDSAAFLARLQRELGDAIATKAFSDPGAALGWMREQDYIGCRLAPVVLVVDQQMAGMSGVEFCASLAGQPCKKILLTGAGGERAAIDAFNRGLIDHAICKSDPDALDQLAGAIAALRLAYFLELSDATIPPASLGEYSFLADPAVAELVRDVCAEHGVVEHYLHAAPCGLMLVDAAGRARLMAIESADGMRAHHEVARDSGAPPSLLEAIDARCIVPWFRNGDGMYDESVGERWYRFCEPARVCEGAQTYYWALFDATRTWV